MRRAALLLVILGLGLALLSSGGVFYLLQQTSEPPAPTPTPVPMVKVVVAAEDIAERTTLTSAMLTQRDWPQSLMPPGAITSTKEAIGGVTSSPIIAGEVILLSKITGGVDKVGLAPDIPPGLVAIVVSLPPVAAAAGGLKSGDTVDVLLSLDYSVYNVVGDESKPMYATFYSIQDVHVLHVGSAAPAPTPGATPSTGLGASSYQAANMATAGANASMLIALLVAPQDALLIKYARERGTIDLVLRSPLFHDQFVTDPVYIDYIMRRFGLPQPVIIQKAEPTPQAGAQR